MTNYEKYRDLVIKCVEDDSICGLATTEDIKNMQNNNKCCKDCSERKPGCHAECSRYANFKESLEKIKLERRREYNKFNRYLYGIDKNSKK